MNEKGPGKVSPLLIPMNMPNGPGRLRRSRDRRAGRRAHHGQRLRLRARRRSPYGLDLLHLDRADVVVVGGTEACIHPLNIAGFAQMRAMSTRNDEPQRASRPWDSARDGFVLGEGAGILVLERLSSAAGARAHAVRPARVGRDDLRRLRHRAARQGGPGAGDDRPGRNGPGWTSTTSCTSTPTPRPRPVGDMGEAGAIADLFGEDTVVTSGKSMTGHLLGAAGAIESISAVLSVHHDVVPPTINLEDPDPDLRIDVPREAREMPVTVAVNNSFGFGGHNASLLFRKA